MPRVQVMPAMNMIKELQPDQPRGKWPRIYRTWWLSEMSSMMSSRLVCMSPSTIFWSTKRACMHFCLVYHTPGQSWLLKLDCLFINWTQANAHVPWTKSSCIFLYSWDILPLKWVPQLFPLLNFSPDLGASISFFFFITLCILLLEPFGGNGNLIPSTRFYASHLFSLGKIPTQWTSLFAPT